MTLIETRFKAYDDCRKALILHRFYVSLERDFECYLKARNIPVPKTEQYHAELLDTICYCLDPGKMLRAVLNELRKFRHFFVKNFTLNFDEHLLNQIYNFIIFNIGELHALIEEVSNEQP